MTAGAVPIKESVGAALRFVRENIRFVGTVALCAAIGQGVFALAGANLFWLIAVLIALVGAHTALTSAALGITPPISQRLVGDATRVTGTMAMIGFILAIVFLMLTFTAMSVLIAPYQTQLQAAKGDAAAVQTIFDTATASNPNVMTIASVVGFILMFAVTTRFYVAAPATIDRGRITLLGAWRMTRGNFLRIAGARLLLLVPAFIFVGAIQTLIARVVGAPSDDPFALSTYSQSNAVGFALFYTVSILIQIGIFSSLEAGLSAYLYKGLKASEPQAPAA